MTSYDLSQWIDYSTEMLDAIAEWLYTPPIYYLVGVIVLCFIVSILFRIVRWR